MNASCPRGRPAGPGSQKPVPMPTLARCSSPLTSASSPSPPAPPAGPDWLHEIKYDGYRLRLERDGDRVRLITRGGYNWTDRYPWIVEAALKNRHRQFALDGEAVVLGVDGVADFNALHSRRHDHEVQFYAFAILTLDGDDLRRLPLSIRKTNLARLLARRPDGIFVAPFEQGEIGPELFRAACNMGLEGLVSKYGLGWTAPFEMPRPISPVISGSDGIR